MILDEPTSQLDPIGMKESSVSSGAQPALQITVILVTHDSERVAEMQTCNLDDDGQIVSDCRPAEFFQGAAQHEVEGIRLPQVTEFCRLKSTLSHCLCSRSLFPKPWRNEANLEGL